MKKTEVVYNNSYKVYIGYTSRNFEGCITSHKSACRNLIGSYAFSEYMIDIDQIIDYNGLSVLRTENISRCEPFWRLLKLTKT